MSNHYTADGRTTYYAEDGYIPAEVDDVRQPVQAVPVRTERDERLADWQLLVDWLHTHPVIDVDPYQLGRTWHVHADTDAEGAAKMAAIAATLGADLEPGGAEHHYRISVEYAPGQEFQVVFITDAYRAANGRRRHVWVTAEAAAAMAGESDA